MAEIEILTDEERSLLGQAVDDGYTPVAKAIRVIDAQAAELETQREMVRTLIDDVNRKVDLLAERDAEAESLRTRLLDREEKFVGQHAELAAANRALARIGVWADTCGSALKPHGGAADSYGDGVRACKAQVKALLSSQPEAPTRFTYVDGDDAERDARLHADGFTPVQSAAPEPRNTQVIDLFEALKRCLEDASREDKL